MTTKNIYTLSEAFKKISKNRISHGYVFDKDKKIPTDVITEILKLTLTSPSSINSSPYKIIIIKSDQKKLELSHHMHDNNRKKVLNSCFSAVFLADIRKYKNNILM